VTRVIEVRVPDMGSFKDVAVIDVLVKPGDAIEPDTPLVTLETEKATMDVPSTVGGIVERVAVSKGGHVSAGDIVVAVRSEEADAAPAGDGTSEPRDTSAAKAPPAAQAAPPAPPAAAQKESRPAPPAAPQRPQAATPAPPLLDEPGFSHAHATRQRALARALEHPCNAERAEPWRPYARLDVDVYPINEERDRAERAAPPGRPQAVRSHDANDADEIARTHA